MSKDEIALEALGLLTKYENLKKEYDSLLAAYNYNCLPRWVDVKTRLPEKPGSLIVWCPSYTNYEEPIIAKYIETNDGMRFWDFDPLNDNDITEDVTHWTYLPMRPSEI